MMRGVAGLNVEVAPGIRRLSQGVANFYLIDEGGKLVLVDAGARADWKFFAAVLGSMGRAVDALDAVLLTHAHADHTGFAERARTEAGAAVWVHRADLERAKGAKPPPTDGSMAKYFTHLETYRTTVSLIRRGGAKVVPIREVSTFEDGETVDVPGRPRVVHAPGHTAGTAGLLLEDRRVLLSGDVLVTFNVMTGRPGPQIMPSSFNHSTPQALASLDALTGLPADLVLPGHGDPWTGDMAEAVRLARAAGPS